MLYSIEELTNPNIPADKLWKRRKYVHSGTQVISNSLNTFSLVVAQGNHVQIWDFWNCAELDPVVPDQERSEFSDDDDDDYMDMEDQDQDLQVEFEDSDLGDDESEEDD